MVIYFSSTVLGFLLPGSIRQSSQYYPALSSLSSSSSAFVPSSSDGPPSFIRPRPYPLQAQRSTSRLQVNQIQYEEINGENFDCLLSRIVDIGKKASFFTLDTEFTGYRQAEKDEYFDTIQQRYERKKEVAEKYLVVQMGLSAFVWDLKAEDWEAYTWNMHLFPAIQADRLFSCDSSSLSFLRSHALDFNKWIDGVPFLALEQEATMRKRIEDQADWDLRGVAGGKKPGRPPWESSDADTVALYKKLVADIEALQPGGIITLENVVWFRRKVVETTITRHPRRANLWLEEETVGDGSKKEGFYRIRYVTNEERKELVEKKKQMAIQELDQAAGAMKVLQILKDSGKPLVGHNFLLDLLFLYSHFVKPTLPETAMGFKTKFQRLFPPIYDTKVLAKALGIADVKGDTNLEGLFKVAEMGGGGGPTGAGDAASGEEEQGSSENISSSSSRGDPDEDSISNGGGAAHEAGHDAYMTGVLFGDLLRRAAEAREADSPYRPSLGPPSLSLVEPWAHKVFMRMSDFDTFDLRTFKQIPDRCNVFHVKIQGNGTLPLLQHRDLREIFSPLGQLQIKAMSKHEAYIIFPQQQQECESKPALEVDSLRELAISRGGASGAVLEILTYEERRVQLGHQW